METHIENFPKHWTTQGQQYKQVPSEGTWDKIQSKRNAASRKNMAKWTWGIAASFLCVYIASIAFSNTRHQWSDGSTSAFAVTDLTSMPTSDAYSVIVAHNVKEIPTLLSAYRNR